MQERDFVPQRATMTVTALSIGALVFAALAAQLVLDWQRSQLADRDREETPQVFAQEQSGLEQGSATDDGAQPQWESQRSHLDSFGWVDREHGIVHVPIDKAMRDYVEQEAR